MSLKTCRRLLRISTNGNPKDIIAIAKKKCNGCKFYYGNNKKTAKNYIGCELGYYPVFVNTEKVNGS